MEPARCVVVLDTNVLHDLRLYLSYAEGKKRYPNDGVAWNSTEAYIKRAVPEQKVRQALVYGGQVLHFMESNGVELVRCAAVEAEWIRLEAYSRGLRSAMVGSRVRGRWFSAFGDEEVNRWMKRKDRESVVASLEEIFVRLDSLGIRISDLDRSQSSGVVPIARGIMTMVYMDPMDSVVYASSLVATATHLVTTDTRFGKVINTFRHPGDAEAASRSRELSSLIRLLADVELAHREFPFSHPITKLRP